VQNSTFFHTPLVSLSRIRNHRIYRARSRERERERERERNLFATQNNKYNSSVQAVETPTFPLFVIHYIYVITIHQRYRRTDRQTNVMLVAYTARHIQWQHVALKCAYREYLEKASRKILVKIRSRSGVERARRRRIRSRAVYRR